MDINEIMKQLAEYKRIQEETLLIIDELQDTLKSHMLKCGIDVLQGMEHKATYKPVISSRIDTTALKKDMPDIAAAYTKTIETKRFTFS